MKTLASLLILSICILAHGEGHIAAGDSADPDAGTFRNEIKKPVDPVAERLKSYLEAFSAGRAPSYGSMAKDRSAAVHCIEIDAKTKKNSESVGMLHTYESEGIMDPAILFTKIKGADTIEKLKNLSPEEIERSRQTGTFSLKAYVNLSRPVQDRALIYNGSIVPPSNRGDGSFVRYSVRIVKNPDNDRQSVMVKIYRYNRQRGVETPFSEAYCL